MRFGFLCYVFILVSQEDLCFQYQIRNQDPKEIEINQEYGASLDVETHIELNK